MKETLADRAQREGRSLDDLVRDALRSIAREHAELKRLDELAQKASKGEFLRILRRAPDVPPIPGDELPER